MILSLAMPGITEIAILMVIGLVLLGGVGGVVLLVIALSRRDGGQNAMLKAENERLREQLRARVQQTETNRGD